MIQTEYEIILPILLSTIISSPPIEKLSGLLTEILHESGNFELPLWENRVTTLNFDVTQNSIHFPKRSKMNRNSPFQTLFKCIFLRITTTVSHEDSLRYFLTSDEFKKLNLSKTEQIKLIQEDLADLLIKGVHDLILASNIAKPGILSTQQGIIKINNNKISTVPSISNNIFFAIEHTRHIGWPLIHELEFVTTWNWLRTIPSYWEGIGAMAIGRALSAFSYLFYSDPIDNPFNEILWSIIGLEALYGEDNSGIQKQIVQRTEALLGKRNTYKRIINEMYGFRSSFLHGACDFPLRHKLFYDTKKHNKFSENAFRPEKIAVVVLTSTLQEMVRQNLKELKFELSLIK